VSQTEHEQATERLARSLAAANQLDSAMAEAAQPAEEEGRS
jgi:hypothetical protein